MTESGARRQARLEEAFPASITTLADPGLLIGRHSQFVEIVQTLRTPGLCPIIFGPPGIGKSTLAWQVEMAAKGSVEVLESVGAGRYTPDLGRSYLTFPISCAITSIHNGKDLLTAIAHHLRRKSTEFVRSGRITPTEQQTTVSLGVSPKLELRRKYEPVAEDLSVGLDETLLNLATDVTDHCHQSILVIIDNLHRIEDTGDLASFLQTVATVIPKHFRFVLVGSAYRVKDLMRDYADLDGVAVPYEIPPMPDADLIRAIEKRLAKLRDQGAVYQFAEELRRTIATVAAGVPSITIQLALESIRAAERDGTQTVTRDHVDQALKRFITLLQSRH